jgi:hypothetical protein
MARSIVSTDWKGGEKRSWSRDVLYLTVSTASEEILSVVGEKHFNMDHWKEKRKYCRKTPPKCHFFHYKLHMN